MLWNLIIAIEHVILLKIYLSVMFPDSAIREKLYMGKDKARYLIIYCIFPAFREKLKSVINDSPWLSISFDESPNRNQQKCHMGVNLRYWNNLKSVTEAYIGSQFFWPIATNLKNALVASLAGIENEFLCLTMDVPSTNWNVLEKSDEHLVEKGHKKDNKHGILFCAYYPPCLLNRCDKDGK